MNPYRSLFVNIRAGNWENFIIPPTNIVPPGHNFVTLSNCNFFALVLGEIPVAKPEDDFVEQILASLTE